MAFRGDSRGVRLAMLVLKLRGTGLQERAEVIPVILDWLLPVRPDRIPAIAQTLSAQAGSREKSLRGLATYKRTRRCPTG